MARLIAPHATGRCRWPVASVWWWRAIVFLRALALLLMAVSVPSVAGELDRAALERLLPAPWVLGEFDPALKLWPLYRREGPASPAGVALDPQGRTVWPGASSASTAPGQSTAGPGAATPSAARPPGPLRGYAFESVDVAPVAGYSGKLINLLILIDASGQLVEVRLLSPREPLFVGGLGDRLMAQFAAQYRGVSVRQSTRILGEAASQPGSVPAGVVALHGIARGTVTAELMDKSIMQAAIKVASARLGIVGTVDPQKMGRLRLDLFSPADWDGLERESLVQALDLRHTDIERAFVGTPVTQTPIPGAAPDRPALRLRVALLSLPQVGRNLLDEAGYQKIKALRDKGTHSLLLVASGDYGLAGEGEARAGPMQRLTLKQGETVHQLKDFIFDHPIRLPPQWQGAQLRVALIDGHVPIDPAQPLELSYRVSRSQGSFYKQVFEKSFPLQIRVPQRYVEPPPAPPAPWRDAWLSAWPHVLVLVLALAVLALALWQQHALVALSARLQRFRVVFLLFTLIFVGWYGQGQLSVVNLTGVVESLRAGTGLQYLMFDPMSLTLWVFVLLSLLVWGRGTFCGWLCPFGALQELLARAAALTGFKSHRFHRDTDARLKKLKYGVLALLLASALFMPAWTPTLAEVEPFKTSISLMFQRDWPYVLWAVLCLLASVWVYRGYCRYLCPLGAALAVVDRLRILNWIPRRAQCGQPCQTCRHRCGYQAIAPSGKIDYAECFQCLDCVDIHDHVDRCAPLLLERRQAARVIALVPVDGKGVPS